ncbi:surface lipoprotein assembly modifier [Novosphingobium sp. PS1R-30]|uniref:Surface lipoprotein assembly modifier n=1 Tax=Novosphingobium anseongense TaxID=3133436 RepID=A0ABU8RZM6_9SPHN
MTCVARPALRALRACCLAGALLLPVSAARAQERPASAAVVGLSPAELFDFADQARDAGDFVTAEAAYRALARHRDVEIRTEARFRLGRMLADGQRKYREAAIEFRRILDEKPDLPAVRLELARMHAQLGNLRAAEREFRAASAAGLPPEVEQIVRFYANALSSRKPFGGSIEIALAPDSNINRATRADSLGTVIGNFAINEDAKARSGLGLNLRGQTYYRHRLGARTDLLARLSASGNLYRDAAFNDIIVSAQFGPEYAIGTDRVALSMGPVWRWYGQQPFSTAWSAGATWQHPTGKRSQLRAEGTVARIDNKFNDLQDSRSFSLSAALDRALTPKFGAGLQIQATRETARDPGYSNVTAGVSAYLFREIGRTTLVASAGYSRLEADRRLSLFPRRRAEDRYSASLAATLRTLQVGSFAPLVRLRWERNVSPVEIYDYRRVAAEFGVTSAF